MTKPIRTVLVGLGKMGMGYDYRNGIFQGTAKSHFGALRKNSMIEIVQLVDLKAPEELCSDPLSLPLFCDFDTFTKESREYDLLVISTPTHTHLEVFFKILKKHSFRFMIFEKPCGQTLEEAKLIFDTLEVKSICWQVNYFRSFLPHTLVAIDRVVKLGEVPFGAEIYGYGSTLNIFSHFIHLLTLFVPDNLLDISQVSRISKSATLTFSSKFKLSIKNIDGLRLDMPVLSIFFPSYTLKFEKNGELIEFILCESDQVFETLNSSDFENYQNLATSEFVQRFQAGVTDNRLNIEKVHELVSQIELIHD